MKSVLITGAAKGIGRACTLQLARLGYRVYAGVRDTADGAALRVEGGDHIVPVPLELTAADQITEAAALLEAQLGPAGLHGLVNNAGIAVAGPLEYLPLAELRRQFEVNVIGQLAMTQALLPLIRRAQGRIVNIGSIAGRSALPLVGAYAASKYAMEALSDALRVELGPWGIHVALIEPGVIATPIWQTSIAAAESVRAQMPDLAIQQYGPILNGLKEAVSGNTARGLAPERVARAIAHALTARRPRTRYVVGRDARVRLLLEALPDRWRDRIIERRLQRMARHA